MTKARKIHPATQAELDRRIRKTWSLKPVTQVRQSKKRYTRKEKHKGSELDL